MKKIGIQGIKGSFHYMAAQEFFPNGANLIEYRTFDELAKGVSNKECDQAVIAIENSIAGSILPNYALLDHFALVIVREFYLKIDHNLMVLPGQKIKEIKEVHSHPMALLQCKSFFEKFPHIKLVETDDTALFAKEINDNKMFEMGAIASKKASEFFKLEIINGSIQTIKNNVTRFVLVQNNFLEVESLLTKAAWKFTLEHKRGSLAAVLNVISDCNLNLTKIQSLPIIETPGKYAFFVDLTFENETDYFKAKSIIEIMSSSFKILGEYKNGKF